MGEETERTGKGFVVIDRRAAAGDDDATTASAADTADAAEQTTAAQAGTPSAERRPEPEPELSSSPEADDAERRQTLPPIDFSTLVHSFAITALYHLGTAPGPAGEGGGEGERTVNLPLAKQNVDILEMLREKTQGNLNPEETRFLDSVLYEARMRFVEVSKASE